MNYLFTIIFRNNLKHLIFSHFISVQIYSLHIITYYLYSWVECVYSLLWLRLPLEIVWKIVAIKLFLKLFYFDIFWIAIKFHFCLPIRNFLLIKLYHHDKILKDTWEITDVYWSYYIFLMCTYLWIFFCCTTWHVGS